MRFVPCVAVHVVRQGTRQDERRLAHETHVAAFAGVGSQVAPQLVARGELLVTEQTNVQLPHGAAIWWGDKKKVYFLLADWMYNYFIH